MRVYICSKTILQAPYSIVSRIFGTKTRFRAMPWGTAERGGKFIYFANKIIKKCLKIIIKNK